MFETSIHVCMHFWADHFHFRGLPDLGDDLNVDDLYDRIKASVPIVLDWAIGSHTCTQALKSEDYACSENSHCIDSDTGLSGYRCGCNPGYQGNPYLNQGCQDVDECADHPNNSLCEKLCINTPGSFNCSCPHGYTGDCRKDGRGCIASYHDQFPWIKVSAAKVADFGVSKLIPLDQTHVATLVLGTSRYLDPEYSRTSQLTEKSDVYSFGVVLAELLTGLKPIIRARDEDNKNLADFLVLSMNKNSLFDIIDGHILREESHEQLRKMAEMAKNCLQPHGEDRPTMKEMAIELEGLKKVTGISTSSQHEQDENPDLYTVPINSYENIPNSVSSCIMHPTYNPS